MKISFKQQEFNNSVCLKKNQILSKNHSAINGENSFNGKKILPVEERK